MAMKGKFLLLHAITPLHPGAGTSMGTVDLPVQRERHTGWPLIPGTSIKGVLRDENRDRPELVRIFGSEPEENRNDLAAGELSFTDARLLAFPVRSIRGTFAWATCPQALSRLQRDYELLGCEKRIPQLDLQEDEAVVSNESIVVDGTKLSLEEFDFKKVTKQDLNWFPFFDAEQRKRLVVLNDNNFSYLTRYATEITARIRLKKDSKRVAKGALFYQEFLPAETVFYSLILLAPGRKDPNALKALNIPPFIQIGGEETIGRGYVKVSTIEEAA